MRRLACLLAILLLPSTLWAMPERAAVKGAGPEEKFQALDKNGDGRVTREEFFEFYPNMHESAFKSIDKDGGESLSLEEWRDFSAGHSRDMGGMGGMSMPGAPGKGSMAGQTGGQPEAKPAKPLFEFAPKNEAQ